MPTYDQGTPLWWVQRLSRQLDDRNRTIKLFDDYYEGRHRLAFSTVKFRQAFGTLFNVFADNWCDLVVDAVEERLNVEGFRYGDEKEGDKQAWQIWQANQLDAESQVAHTEALINGEAYALVWYDQADPVTPVITVEHPSQTIVATHAGSRRSRAAALKRWVDDDEFLYSTLYLPDGIYKFRSKSKAKANSYASSPEWLEREVGNEVWPLPNPFNIVPVIPLVNRPRLLGSGVSEIAKVIPVQDAVNKLISDMLVAAEFGAAPQRWATGLEVPKDPTTGEAIDIFGSLVNRLLVSKNKDTTFGQFPATDLQTFVSAVEMLVQHIASQTRTPPHYFYLSGQFPSGESIKSAETGLVAKAERKMRHFGESWEEVIRLAFLVKGQKRRSSVQNAETIWRDPESRSEGEHIDSVLKRKALEVPREQLWEDAGYTPQQIERFKSMTPQLASPVADGQEEQPVE